MLKLDTMETNKKVVEALKEQGRSKKWLSEQMQMSRITLHTRLRDNEWRIGEVIQLQRLLGIK